MANIKAFSFYESYHEAFKDLPTEQRKEMLLAVDDYVFEDIEPNFEGTNKIIWTLIKPNLDKSKNRSNVNSGAPTGNKNALKNKEKNNSIKIQSNFNQSPHMKSYSYIYSYINNIIINNKSNNSIINLFKEYINIRIKNKYNISETIIKRLVKKLNDYGSTDEDKEEILLQAINGEWKDFYPLEKKEKKKGESITYETIWYWECTY